jgi:mono/diheme cytochrome c family protein
MIKRLRPLAWIGLGVFAGMLVFAAWPSAHALPEYAARTGQPCATCHANPAGGGPRTMRGLLWVAEGKPDEVPQLPGSEPSSGETALDGRALFDQFFCSGCHGQSGGGAVGPALTQTEWPAEEVRGVIRNGQGAMKGFPPDTMSEAQLAAIVEFVQALGRGEVQAGPVLDQRLLPAARTTICGAGTSSLGADCGGN